MSTEDLAEEMDEIEEPENDGEVGMEENEQINEGGAEDETDDAKQPVQAKKVIRRPRPKLNSETLRGKRGLLALESFFERAKFKGRGYEEKDLSVILKTYEYWCHRLFPKYPFDDCIEKIETLGTKKAVVTTIKKIRSDLIDFMEPSINNDDSDTEQMELNYGNESVTPTQQEVDDISENVLEQIRLNKERAMRIREKKLQQKRLIEQESGSVENEIESYMDDESLFDGVIGQIEIGENDPQDIFQNIEQTEPINKILNSSQVLSNCEFNLTESQTSPKSNDSEN